MAVAFAMMVAMRTGLVLALVSVLCALAPLAHATPPDQVWRPGIYDGANLDDVVTLLEAAKVMLGSGPPAPSFVQLVFGVPRRVVLLAMRPPARAASTRAPPAPFRAIV